MHTISDLESLVTHFGNDIYYYKSNRYNESSCRLEFIDILFKVLGWDVSNESGKAPQYREVIVEDYNRETGRPDYSMTLSGVSKFFVEAKKPSVDITSNMSSIFQARSYGWSAKHKIVVLTNFEYLMIYDTSVMPLPEDNPDVALIKKYNYTEYVNKYDEIDKLISREFVYSGEFDESFSKVTGQKKQVDEIFLEQINQWRIGLGQHLFNKGYNIDIINDTTQDFINQIIFLRICEDRNLPIYRKLIETINDENKIKEELNHLFVQADKRYNSGLFDGEYLIFDLENEIISGMIKTLYYPKSPYVFNLIQSSLLGQIYEMFLVKHLIVNDSGRVELKEKKQNENRAVVTTPVEIVKYMTEKSLNPLITDKTPAEIKKLRIVDIACGSGIFLIEAYDYILNYCITWYKQNNIEYLIHLGGDNYKLPLSSKKELLLSCIYGIDIDPHAVEVAKFSLLLKLLEDENQPTVEQENPILPDLIDNILMGNSLIDSSLITKYKAEKEIDEIVPFDWKDINNGEKFNLIIGNPPYVKTEDMKNLLSGKEVNIYKKRYKSSYKQFDKYFIFIERSLEHLKDNGVLCYIVPNKFSKIVSGKKLRQIITERSLVKEYVDFGSAQLFEDKTIYSSVLILEKMKHDTFIYREVDDIKKWWSTKDDSSKELKLNSNLLSDSPWVLVADPQLMKTINNLYKDSIPLKNIADPFNGIQTSAERPPVYWFSTDDIIEEDTKYFYIHKFGHDYKIEKSILKPYFKPVKKNEKNMYTYDILNTNKWIIFPYDNNGRLLDIRTMRCKYPETLKYLEDRYDLLEPKQLSTIGKGRDVPLATSDTWYQYGRHQGFTAFQETKKLIVGIMSKQPMYVYDDNDYVIASGGTAGYCAIKAKETSKYALEFIQAYLTHPLIEKIMSIIGSDFEGGFYSRGTSVLDAIPIKKLNFSDKEHKNMHDNVVSRAQEIYYINSKLSTRLTKKEEVVLKRRKQRLIEEIMQILDGILY